MLTGAGALHKSRNAIGVIPAPPDLQHELWLDRSCYVEFRTKCRNSQPGQLRAEEKGRLALPLTDGADIPRFMK